MITRERTSSSREAATIEVLTSGDLQQTLGGTSPTVTNRALRLNFASHKHRLFVYGTLKRGQVRAEVLRHQTLLGPAVTIAQYRLYDCGSYPALVEHAEGLSIRGELWEVDAACLERIDEIEGVAENLYQRQRVKLAEPFAELFAETYLYQRDASGLTDCGSVWPGGVRG